MAKVKGNVNFGRVDFKVSILSASLGNTAYLQVQAVLSSSVDNQYTPNIDDLTLTYKAVPTVSHSTTKYYYFGQQRVAVRNGNELYYLHGDHLGSTSLTTCGENCPLPVPPYYRDPGDIVSERRYHPYGLERYSDGTSQTDFGYTGQREDRSFEIIEMGVRRYDPLIGRWLSPDSMIPDFENSQSLNRFAYVDNNPLRYIDPSGHETTCGLNCDPEDNSAFDEPPPDESKGILEDWSIAGLRVDFSAMILIGVDINVDLVVVDWNPKESSIIIQGGWQYGLDAGLSLNSGPLFTRNLETLDEYKNLPHHAGGTLADDIFLNIFSLEGDIAWSDDYGFTDTMSGQGPQASFVGVVGTLEEFGIWRGETLITVDMVEVIYKIFTSDLSDREDVEDDPETE